MRPEETLQIVAAHAEGEIGKVIVGGAPEVPGRSVLEKLAWLNRVDDGLRRFCVREPRGTPQASVNLLLAPIEPGTDAGFIVMQPDGCHAMSGSNAICVTTVLLETGRVAMREPESRLVLDTAAGPVAVLATCRDGKCEQVRLEMPWSFVVEDGLKFDVEGLGSVDAAIAFGGVFYLLTDARSLGLEITPGNARKLVDAGMAILRAAQRRWQPEHPERAAIKGLAYLMFMSDENGHRKNATIMPPGRVDRSPCGTGSSARLALLHARGMAGSGAEMQFESIIGSRFAVGIREVGEVAGRSAIRPWISGRAWIHAEEQWFSGADDPFVAGHALPDVYGPGLGS